MPEEKTKSLTQVQVDALREVSNIGAGSATTALSQFINKTVRMNPTAEIIFTNPEDLQLVIGMPKIAVIASDIPEKICGHLIIIFEEECVSSLVSFLLGGSTTTPVTSSEEIKTSALQEIGGVMFGAYLTAMGHMTSVSLMITPPSYDSGQANKLLDQALNRSRAEDEITICFETSFTIEADKDIPGYLIFIPSHISLNVLLKLIGAENVDILPQN